MPVPDITNNPAHWERTIDRTPLWRNLIHPDIWSTDGGLTYTIATEREHPEVPRFVRNSRKV